MGARKIFVIQLMLLTSACRFEPELVEIPLDQAQARSLISSSIIDNLFPNMFIRNGEGELRLHKMKKIVESLEVAPIYRAFHWESVRDYCRNYYQHGPTNEVTTSLAAIVEFWADQELETELVKVFDDNLGRQLASVAAVARELDTSVKQAKLMSIPVVIDMMEYLENRVPQEFFTELPAYEQLNAEIMEFANKLNKHPVKNQSVLTSPEMLAQSKKIVLTMITLIAQFQDENIYNLGNLLKLNQLKNEMSEEDQLKFQELFFHVWRIANINGQKRVLPEGEEATLFTDIVFEEDTAVENVFMPDYLEGYSNSMAALKYFASTFNFSNDESVVYQLCGNSENDLWDNFSGVIASLGEQENNEHLNLYEGMNERRRSLQNMYIKLEEHGSEITAAHGAEL